MRHATPTNMRHATRADARAVWEAQTKPSVRSVANALNASGQFEEISYRTIHRWKQAGWQVPVHPVRPPPARASLDAAVPVVVGDPTATMAKLREALESVIGKGELARLLEAPGDKLYTELERQTMALLIMAEKLAMHRALETDPQHLGNLAKAAAGAMLSMTSAARLRMPAEDKIQTSDVQVIEQDDLEPAWAEFRRQIAAG
jgi:hypothetical protein